MPALSSAAEPCESAESQDRLRTLLLTQFDFIWRFVRRLGIPAAEVDDVVQKVFLVASERLPDIEVGKERSFLISTSVRVAANARRSIGRRKEDLGLEADTYQHQPAPDELLERKRRRELLDQLVIQLPEEQRTVFVLSELEGLSRSEVAQLLELPMGTVASRLRLAKQRFNRLVEAAAERIVDPPSAQFTGGRHA